jgi:hypothetical protein
MTSGSKCWRRYRRGAVAPWRIARDLLDVVEFARGDLDNQIAGLVVGERQAAAVEAVGP